MLPPTPIAIMKILLLGKDGLLGRYLHIALKEAGHTLHALGKNGCNIGVSHDCQRVVDSLMPDLVINAAAYTDVENAESNREEAFAVNGYGLKNLARCCEKHRIRIIHFSTDYVFDGVSMQYYTERDCPNPLNVYGKSKLFGEQQLARYSTNFAIVRTSAIFGNPLKDFPGKIIAKLLSKKKICVVDDQEVTITYAGDLANAVVARLIDNPTPNILNITNSGRITWHKYALELCSILNVDTKLVMKVKTSDMTFKAVRPARSCLSNVLFVRLFGVHQPTWQDSLKRYIQQTYLKKAA